MCAFDFIRFDQGFTSSLCKQIAEFREMVEMKHNGLRINTILLILHTSSNNVMKKEKSCLLSMLGNIPKYTDGENTGKLRLCACVLSLFNRKTCVYIKGTWKAKE